MDNKSIDIIEKCLPLFMRLGIKSLTMDDVARELSMSKKTLYASFEDKNDLVYQCVAYDLNCDCKELTACVAKTNSAIEGVFAMMQYVLNQVKEIHPSILYDLQKFHPKAFNLFREHKINFILEAIHQNLVQGVKEDVYRSDFNTDVVARLYVGRIDLIFDPNYFPSPKYKTSTLYLEMMKYHLNAIVTSKGKKQIEKQLKLIEKQMK